MSIPEDILRKLTHLQNTTIAKQAIAKATIAFDGLEKVEKASAILNVISNPNIQNIDKRIGAIYENIQINPLLLKNPGLEKLSAITNSNLLSSGITVGMFKTSMYSALYENPKLSGFFSHQELFEVLSKNNKISRIVSHSLFHNQNLLQINYDLFKTDVEQEDAPARQLLVNTETKDIKSLIRDIYKNNWKLYTMHPREFEEVIAELLAKRGYDVNLTKQTRDGGYDLIAISSRDGMLLKYLVECKRYKKERKVGIDVIRSLSDVVNTEKANKGIIFTTSYFSADAKKRHKANPYLLDLKDHDDVISWVTDYLLQ